MSFIWDVSIVLQTDNVIIVCLLTETAVQNVSMLLRSETQWQVNDMLPNIG
jgi:hypothetical protein